MSEKLSFNQITEQLENGHGPTVLVERSQGKITTGEYAGENPEKPGTYMVNVMTERGGQLVPGYREISAEDVSDSHQEKLAERLAGKALRISIGHAAMPMEVTRSMNPGFIDRVPGTVRAQSTESASVTPERTNADRIAELSKKMDEMVDGLSEDDKSRLFRFARYSFDKEEAQKAGDGQGSSSSGQYAGQEYRAMSSAARSVSSEFRDSLRHLSWLRDQEN